MTPKELLEKFEDLYPDEFNDERTALMNKVSARIMKCAEQYNAVAMMEHKYGSLHVEAESKYAESRVREEAYYIVHEETAEMLARVKLKLVIRETEVR